MEEERERWGEEGERFRVLESVLQQVFGEITGNNAVF